MKFIDEAFITVQSGDGGNGCVSFRREKFVPRGGPNGGDGGKGGDVILRSTSRRRTLYPFRFKRQFKAPIGGHGQGSRKTGKNGSNLSLLKAVGAEKATITFDPQPIEPRDLPSPVNPVRNFTSN